MTSRYPVTFDLLIGIQTKLDCLCHIFTCNISRVLLLQRLSKPDRTQDLFLSTPFLWNNITADIRQSDPLEAFKSKIKTHLSSLLIGCLFFDYFKTCTCYQSLASQSVSVLVNLLNLVHQQCPVEDIIVSPLRKIVILANLSRYGLREPSCRAVLIAQTVKHAAGILWTTVPVACGTEFRMFQSTNRGVY